jgi:hypothetical protein
MSREILIRISADAKNFKQKLKEVEGQTADLNETLKSTAFKAGIAFAGLTANHWRNRGRGGPYGNAQGPICDLDRVD